MAFNLIELSDWQCFGWTSKKDGPSWYDVAQKTIEHGWNNTSDNLIGKSLAKNVKESYLNICSVTAKDLDDGRIWSVCFINDHGLWRIKLKDSPDTEVLPEDAEQFFKSEEIIKFASRCYNIIMRGAKCYNEIIRSRLEHGYMGLLDVDTVKLDRILTDADTGRFMDNLRNCRYELQ